MDGPISTATSPAPARTSAPTARTTGSFDGARSGFLRAIAGATGAAETSVPASSTCGVDPDTSIPSHTLSDCAAIAIGTG